jgi:hypothetical protein
VKNRGFTRLSITKKQNWQTQYIFRQIMPSSGDTVDWIRSIWKKILTIWTIQNKLHSSVLLLLKKKKNKRLLPVENAEIRLKITGSWKYRFRRTKNRKRFHNICTSEYSKKKSSISKMVVLDWNWQFPVSFFFFCQFELAAATTRDITSDKTMTFYLLTVVSEIPAEYVTTYVILSVVF